VQTAPTAFVQCASYLCKHTLRREPFAISACKLKLIVPSRELCPVRACIPPPVPLREPFSWKAGAWPSQASCKTSLKLQRDLKCSPKKAIVVLRKIFRFPRVGFCVEVLGRVCPPLPHRLLAQTLETNWHLQVPFFEFGQQLGGVFFPKCHTRSLLVVYTS
jgi:hypothetical protein